MEDEDIEKVFMFAGYTSDVQVQEKLELTEKIKKLGGEVISSAQWDNRCTHVITSSFVNYNAKVLACLAHGGWVVTRRFVDNSYKTGAWKPSKPFICDEIVLTHRERKRVHGDCFKDMKVLFLLELEPRVKAYSDVIRAGGGTVVEDKTLPDMIANPPGPDELTHVVVDPYIMSDVDPRYIDFNKFRRTWSGSFIYYRYFFDFIRFPGNNHSPQDYCIYDHKVMQMARENGDFKRPEGGARASSSVFQPQRSQNQASAPVISGARPTNAQIISHSEGIRPSLETAKRSSELNRENNSNVKRQRTEYTSAVVQPNVIDVEDSDDDIEVLEQKLVKEKGNKDNRLYFEGGARSKSVINVDLDVSDIEDSAEKSDNESVAEESQDESLGDGEAEKTTEAVEQQPQDKVEEEKEIEILGTGKHKPKEIQSTKKSKMFKQKLDKLKAREEKRENKILKRSSGSRRSRDSGSPDLGLEEAIPVIPTVIQKIPVPKPKQPMAAIKPDDELLLRIKSTINSYQDDTYCLEVSYVTRRTMKYDKHKEALPSKKKVVPVEERVKEEFCSREFDRKLNENGDAMDFGMNGDNDRSETCVSFAGKLDYLKCYTNLNTHPTSFILHSIMNHFILNQKVTSVALRSYQYINRFMFHYLGSGNPKRADWLDLILTALRESTSQQHTEKINLESGPDLQSCYKFFSTVLKKPEDCDLRSTKLMLRLIVNICQTDFEIWWKHFKRTEQKDNRDLSYPVLFYLLNGKRDLMKHIEDSVLKLYQYVLQKDSDFSCDARKLVALCGMLVAHLDLKDKKGILGRGMKHELAKKISDIFATVSLNSDDMFIEMSLLQPSWLSHQVSRLYLGQESKVDVKTVKDVIDKSAELSNTCDTNLTAALDNFLIKSFASMHIHSIARTHWHYQNAETPFQVFSNTCKLAKKKDRQGKGAGKNWSQINDVKFSMTTLSSEVNSLVDVINKDKALPQVGVLKSLVFNMTTPDKF